jgi:2-oxoglutarate ferredoxin oxidoreductase subunit alpha
MANARQGRRSVSLVFVGSGGAGAMTSGTMLLDAAARAGWYGVMTRSLGPQILGGEAAALLRLSAEPVETHDDSFDLLFAIDWKNFGALVAEVPLRADSIVFADPEGGEAPPEVEAVGSAVTALTMKALAADIPGGRANMLVLGAAASLIGVPLDEVLKTVERHLGSKGAEAVEGSANAIRTGAEAVDGTTCPYHLAPPCGNRSGRWMISGNEAIGLGAVRGGVRFAAAYPITPATDISEWLAAALGKIGGTLVQAEDELASINMVIGASFGGVPSLTATSGPGLSLMTESIGLAVAGEVPIVVVDVMRCGPSTGIATKSEQSDLNIATYGLHGDAPHVVIAPNSIADCATSTQWAMHLAESLQTAVIVLSDQVLGQSLAVIDRSEDTGLKAVRAVSREVNGGYKRYVDVESGISTMALPGTPGGQYTGEGLTHSESGNPSTSASDHLAQLDKRARKLADHDFGDDWAEIEGDGDLAIISWGSTGGTIREALGRRAGDAPPVRHIALRLIAPSQPEKMARALEGVKRVLVIEQSHSGQFHRYLRAHYDLPPDVASYCRPGPIPFLPGEICQTIADWQR